MFDELSRDYLLKIKTIIIRKFRGETVEIPFQYQIRGLG